MNLELGHPAKLLSIMAILLCQSLPLMARPSEIIVIRHGEKPKDRGEKHLSSAGEKRARELVPFLKANAELMEHGAPIALFATHSTKNGRGQRPGETLQPLAKSLKLPIQKPFESDRPGNLAQLVLSNPAYDQKTVLICWTHEFIPPLIEALGVHPAPPKLHDDVYDWIYVITYEDGKAVLRELKQSMPSKPAKRKSD